MEAIIGRIKQSQGEHVLTDKEVAYLKVLNYALMTSTLRDKALSGFLYYVCFTRFGYTEDQTLLFEIDLDKDDNLLIVKVIPNEAIEQELKKQQEQNPPSHSE